MRTVETSPVLPISALIRANSIDELITQYTQAGLTFPTQQDFIVAVRNDWEAGREALWSETREKINSGQQPLIPQRPPSIEVIIDGVTYRIYGEIHTVRESVKRYGALFLQELSATNNLLLEQNIKVQNLPDTTPSVELFDNSLLPPYSDFEYFLPMLKGAFYSAVNYTLSKIGNKRVSTPSEKSEAFAVGMLSMPLELIARSLPAYVELGLREGVKQAKPRLTQSQKRSAYMAEFARIWRRGEGKVLLVGAGHAPEMKYFLLNGVKDHRITELASRHVELLETDPERYQRMKANDDRVKTTITYTAVLVISLVIGGLLGSGSVLTAMYLASKF
ncbi:hypothetical protein HYY73_00425 [Candidatus Woesearchaeota archaeon]|nr:hypothetical protein [Candidatus Woesearchaeota archaeon]